MATALLMLTLAATGVIHHRGGQRGRLDQSKEAKRRGRLCPHVVRGHHHGEKQQRCRHLHLKSRCLLTLVIPSTLPSLLSISHQETAPPRLHERFTRPSPLISISVLFVPLPSLRCRVCETRRWVCERKDGPRHSSERSFSLSSWLHHLTIKVFKTVYCNI